MSSFPMVLKPNQDYFENKTLVRDLQYKNIYNKYKNHCFMMKIEYKINSKINITTAR